MILTGCDFDELTFHQIMAVLYSMLIDDIVSGDVPRAKAREHIDDMIQENSTIYLMQDFERRRKADAQHAQREWGASQAGELGIQRAQAIVGGPAGPPQ